MIGAKRLGSPGVPALSGIRLVATDLDGTIVRADGTIAARTSRALAALRAAGREIVFVTGRPPRWMREIADQTGYGGVAICSNGAVRYDVGAERIVSTHTLAPATIAALIDRLGSALPGVAFAAEYGEGFALEPAYPVVAGAGAIPTVCSRADLASRPAVKILARQVEFDPDLMAARAAEVAGGLATFTHSASLGLLEISPPGVTKASGLAEHVAELGIDRSEVMAFGDMPNDVAMLRWAGYSVAVANAHIAVRKAADEVTADVEADGVAAVLERLLAG